MDVEFMSTRLAQSVGVRSCLRCEAVCVSEDGVASAVSFVLAMRSCVKRGAVATESVRWIWGID